MRYQKVMIKTKNTEAELTLYLLDNFPAIDMERTRPTILICPGGAYRIVSEREGEPIAMQMLAQGFQAAVLRYNVAPTRFPNALAEAACSIAHLREHAKEYGVNPEKIIMAGFSAAGHLTASLGVFWQEEWLKEYTGYAPEQVKPNGLILSYPVITSGEYANTGSFKNLLGQDATEEQREYVSVEKRVTKNVPPCFIWHTMADPAVPVENSLMFASALRKAGVKFELHIFPQGAHGLALATEETAPYGCGNFDPKTELRPECAEWIRLAARFVKEELE
jgi:acetyl esterase/lipase